MDSHIPHAQSFLPWCFLYVPVTVWTCFVHLPGCRSTWSASLPSTVHSSNIRSASPSVVLFHSAHGHDGHGAWPLEIGSFPHSLTEAAWIVALELSWFCGAFTGVCPGAKGEGRGGSEVLQPGEPRKAVTLTWQAWLILGWVLHLHCEHTRGLG